ncbi:MAG: hypothetical protein WCR46_10490, partial [Deltaproteobacteria bacterium]
MHGSAGRVEHPYGSWVFQRTIEDVDRMPQQLFLGKVFITDSLYRCSFARFQENFGRSAHQIATKILQTGFPLRHFIPDSPQSVVCEKFHH